MKPRSKYTRPLPSEYILPRSLKKPIKPKRKPLLRDTEDFVNIEDTLSMRMYDEYRTKVKNPMSIIKFRKVIKKFFVELRKQMLNNEAGVFIKNFGYFCFIRNPKPNKRNHRHTMGHNFKPTFIPIRKDNLMQTWTMDGTFVHFIDFVKRMKMLKGKKYKMAFTMLNNLYGTNQIVVYKKEINDNNK